MNAVKGQWFQNEGVDLGVPGAIGNGSLILPFERESYCTLSTQSLCY